LTRAACEGRSAHLVRYLVQLRLSRCAQAVYGRIIPVSSLAGTETHRAGALNGSRRSSPVERNSSMGGRLRIDSSHSNRWFCTFSTNSDDVRRGGDIFRPRVLLTVTLTIAYKATTLATHASRDAQSKFSGMGVSALFWASQNARLVASRLIAASFAGPSVDRENTSKKAALGWSFLSSFRQFLGLVARSGRCA
jgi:hypothetical protein